MKFNKTKNGICIILFLSLVLLIYNVNAQECSKIYDEWTFNYTIENGIIQSRLITSNNYPECSTALEYRTYCDFEYKIVGTETYVENEIHKCVKDDSRIIKHPIGTDLFDYIDISKETQIRSHKVDDLPYYLDINNKGYAIDTRTIFHDKARLWIGYNENINVHPYYSFQKADEFELKKGESREFDFDNDKTEELEITLNSINEDEATLTFRNRLKPETKFLKVLLIILVLTSFILGSINIFLKHKKSKKKIKKHNISEKILLIITIIGFILVLIGIFVLLYKMLFVL